MLRQSSPPFRLRLLSAIPRSHLAKPASEKGLTLLECLVAIVIISITVVSITPPIFVATASRIQSRRAEQANQIAQSEIDRIRTIVERGSKYTENELPAIGGGLDVAAPTVAAATGVDDKLLASPDACPLKTKYPEAASPTAIATKVIPVDVDGDCEPEFAMQVFRSNDCIPASLTGATPPVTLPYAFTAGVRVYGYEPDKPGNPGNPMSNLSKERARLGLTAGRGGDNSASGAERKALQVLYTKVSRVGNEQALECAEGKSPPPPPAPVP